MKKVRIHRMPIAVKKKLTDFFSEFPEKIYFSDQKIILGDQEKITHVYFIEQGRVRMFYECEHGEDIMVHIFKEDSFFPIIQILSNTRNMFTCEAMNTVHVRIAPKEAVLTFLKRQPDVLYDLTTRLSSGLVSLSETMCQMFFSSAQQRILNFLSVYVRRFGVDNGERFVTVPFVLKHKEIADSVGLTRETVTRELKKLEKEGRVKKKGHFYSILK